MTDEARTPENEAPTATEEENPFAGFESSEFSGGQEVEAAPSEEVEDDPESEEEPSGVEEAPSDDDDEPSRPKGKQTAQERINELTRLRREAERRAEAAEAELQQRRQPPQQDPEPEAPQTPEQEAPQQDEAPSPDDFDYGELDPRYIRALASFEAKQQFAALIEDVKKADAEEAAKQEQQEVQRKFQKQIEDGSKKHDDFYERVIIGAEKGSWPLSDHLGRLLVESEVGADIAYHLASHPEEATQVFRQPPLEQARYFGRMEAKFSAEQSAAPSNDAGKTAETRTPKAPPPVTPARGSDGKFSPSAKSDDFAAFEKHANNQ